MFTSILWMWKKHEGQEQWFSNTIGYAGFKQLIYLFAKCLTVSWMSLVAITFICPSFHQPGYRKDLYPHYSDSNKIILSLARGTRQQFLFLTNNILSSCGFLKITFFFHEIPPTLHPNLKFVRETIKLE